MAHAIAKPTFGSNVASDAARRHDPSVRNTFNDTMLTSFDQWRQDRALGSVFTPEKNFPADYTTLRFEHYVGASYGFTNTKADVPVVGQWIIARLLQRQKDGRPYQDDPVVHEGMVKDAFAHLNVPLTGDKTGIDVCSPGLANDRFDHHHCLEMTPLTMFHDRNRVRRPFAPDLLAVIWDQDPNLLLQLLPEDGDLAMHASRLMGSSHTLSCNGLVNAVSRVLNDGKVLEPSREHVTMRLLTSALPLALAAMEPLMESNDEKVAAVLSNWHDRLPSLVKAHPDQAGRLSAWDNLVTGAYWKSMEKAPPSMRVKQVDRTNVVTAARRWVEEHQERLDHPLSFSLVARSKNQAPSLSSLASLPENTLVFSAANPEALLTPLSQAKMDTWFERKAEVLPSARGRRHRNPSVRGLGLDKDLLPGMDNFGQGDNEGFSEDAAVDTAKNMLGLSPSRFNKPR